MVTYSPQVVDCGFDPRSGQAKTWCVVAIIMFIYSAADHGLEPQSYMIGNCLISAKLSDLRINSKDWLAQSQDSVLVE